MNTEESKATKPIGGADNASEYFQLKNTLKTLRADLKDFQIQQEDYEELQKLIKKAKELREKVNDDENIKQTKEKISQLKERMDLLKELIRVDLIENALEEVKKDGKTLKLVYILKELTDKE